MPPGRYTLALAPETPFSAIAWELLRMGWQPEAHPDEPAPAEGEGPEHASWIHEGCTATYTLTPAIFLRLLTLEGPRALELGDRIALALPMLGQCDARRLMESPEIEQVLLGIYAAGALQALPLIGQIAALNRHPDALVSGAARGVLARLTEYAAAIAPSVPSLLFGVIPDPRQRRQVLRWLVHNREEPQGEALAFLRSACTDPDAEVRITAMLAAARLRAAPLAGLIRKLELPGSAEGCDAADRRLLEALQHACLELLGGLAAPDEPGSPPTTRELMRGHLLRCAAGSPVTHYDAAFLLVTALTQPVPIAPPPQRLPPGLVAEGEEWRLARSGVAMVWVPPLPHWIGTALAAGLPNPIRAVTPAEGFFIARQPVADACTFAEAAELCRSLSDREGIAVRLPAAQEWEMAARGPDARRYPWGNLIERGKLEQPTPWGLERAVGSFAQWSSDTAAEDSRIVCGGSRTLRPEILEAAAPGASNIGLRPLIEAVAGLGLSGRP